jgi:hypothetical protein
MNIIYLLSLLILPRYEKNFYYSFFKFYKFFVWLLFSVNSPILFKILYFISFVIFILIYPIVALLIKDFKWSKLIGLDLVFPAQLALMKNYNKTKLTFSKLYWFKIFNKYKINTPKVICYIKNNKFIKINKINKNKEYIMKPIYGSNGNSILKCKFDKFQKNNFILQEYINDYENKNRTIRIVTLNDDNIYSIFLIIEYKSSHIASNTTNLLVNNGISLSFKQKLCRNNYCDFLSKEINILIKDASKKLLSLHKNEFDFVPLIGWDIILSKKNYFVLEGNITPDISFKKNEYIKIIKKYYNY